MITACLRQWWFEVDLETTFRLDAIKLYPVSQYFLGWPTWLFIGYSHRANYGAMFDEKILNFSSYDLKCEIEQSVYAAICSQQNYLHVAYCTWSYYWLNDPTRCCLI